VGSFGPFGGARNGLSIDGFENHRISGLWDGAGDQGSLAGLCRGELQLGEGIHDLIREFVHTCRTFLLVEEAKGIAQPVCEDQIGKLFTKGWTFFAAGILFPLLACIRFFVERLDVAFFPPSKSSLETLDMNFGFGLEKGFLQDEVIHNCESFECNPFHWAC
jgi:hypothetical protein